ncbi:Uncharacterised protein [Bordetella pertussis]|nr:Uncharacterised protein [Bordetella pertussis]CFW03437.1 Uncharacterised protein [Bordetella pertussis]CFW43223.1 Uncharacterised protein [Bordetella pertussis]CPL48873.1 Uncharacterised protein [Bordetella pertussis]CPN12988.1 Uncharacterised protein [Bordetella pertussis]
MTLTAPCRLDSFSPSGPRIIGTWPYSGRVAPSARRMLIWRGVLLTWSSPRSTWVMPMSQSSTTTQKL